MPIRITSPSPFLMLGLVTIYAERFQVFMVERYHRVVNVLWCQFDLMMHLIRRNDQALRSTSFTQTANAVQVRVPALLPGERFVESIRELFSLPAVLHGTIIIHLHGHFSIFRLLPEIFFVSASSTAVLRWFTHCLLASSSRAISYSLCPST